MANLYLKFAKKYKLQNFVVFLLIAIGNLLPVLAALLLTNILNALIHQNMQRFIFWILIDLGIWIVSALVYAYRDILKERVIQNQINEIREAIIKPLTEMSYQSFAQNSKEDYNSWLNNDMAQIHDNGFARLYNVFSGITSIFFNAVALFYIHWTLFLSALFLAIVLYYFPRIFKKRLAQATNSVSDVSNKALATSTDFISGFEVLYQNNQLQFFKQKIMSGFKALKHSKVEYVKVQSVMNYSLFALSFVAQIIIFLVGGGLILNHLITTGVIFSLANLAGPVLNNASNVANDAMTYKATLSLLEKYPQEENSGKALEAPTDFNRGLEIRDLKVTLGSQTIQYPDFIFEKGKKYVVQGDSGSGKSTLVALLQGNLMAYEGQIFLDGKNYRELDSKGLQNIRKFQV